MIHPDRYSHTLAGTALRRSAVACLCASIVLSACNATMPRAGGAPTTAGSSSEAPGYVQNCLVFGVIGAVINSLPDMIRGKPKSPQNSQKKTVEGFVAGCVIGFATTAVGKLFVEPAQQRAAEAAAQRDAKRRLDELDRYAAAKTRLESAPAATPRQREQRDGALDKLRQDFEREYEKPRVESVGPGSTIEFRGVAPSEIPDPRQANVCVERTMLANTPSGRARQKETVCRNPQGQPVTGSVETMPS